LLVLQRLKENPRTRDIAVIFISASCETMDRVRCLDLGAIDFIRSRSRWPS
jgi:CheY-like chemotaxis protein